MVSAFNLLLAFINWAIHPIAGMAFGEHLPNSAKCSEIYDIMITTLLGPIGGS